MYPAQKAKRCQASWLYTLVATYLPGPRAPNGVAQPSASRSRFVTRIGNMHYTTLTFTDHTERNLGTALDQRITIEPATHAW